METKTQTFEDFLETQFAADYHGFDDDMPDAFDAWMGNLDVQEVIDYADLWGETLKPKTF